MEFKSIKCHQLGDIIIVKLMDTTYKVYFKGKANINNPREMKELKEELRHKGVAL